MRSLVAIALGGAILTGCTEAQRYALQVQSRAQAAMVPFRACQTTLEADPRFTWLYQKTAVSTAADPFREPTTAQLSDSEIISDYDKALFLVWFGEAQTCATPTMQELGQLAPEIEIYFANAQADEADLINEFLIHQHTFGEANAAISAFKVRTRAAAKEMAANLKARIEASDQDERQETAENVAFIVGYVAVAVATRGRMSLNHLADRQAALARSEGDYLRFHPSQALIRPIKVIRCDGIGVTLGCVLK
jgi:hypothetical protein